MIRIDRFPRGRRGFAMILLAIAAASVCTVTVATQGSSAAYEMTAVRQRMRNEQARWLLESYRELALAQQCAPPWTGPGAEPQLFRTGANAPFKASQARITAGYIGVNPPERIQVSFGTNFGVAGYTYDPTVKVEMFSDPAATKRTLELAMRLRNVNYQTDAATLEKHEAVVGTQRHTAWAVRESDPF